MEESGRTIRETTPDPPLDIQDSWLCDDQDRPVIQFVHDGAGRQFRVRVGVVWYEHFSERADGAWLYRRAR